MPKNFIVHPDFEHLQDELKSALQSFSKVNKNVLKSDRNVIKKMTVQGIDFTIKKFKMPTIAQALVYRFFRKSKAKRSFQHAKKLLSFGIDTPQHVVYFEHVTWGLRKSFYISAHVDYDFDFRALIHNPQMEKREEILRQFTRFTFLLHENNVNFLDHSPGNTLIVEKENGDYGFFLIDLNRMRFEPLNFEQRLRNFRRLWLSKTMVKIMAEEYAKLSKKSFEETYALLLKHSRNFQRKTVRKKLWKKKF